MQHLQSNSTLQGGKYRIERVLGQGGFGITYLAYQPSLQREVAIKEFFMKDYCSRDDDSRTMTAPSLDRGGFVDRYRKKFIKEAQNLAKLKHPHIISVIEVFEENNTVYYVMPYLSKGSLQDYVEKHGALSEQEAMKYVKQIARALKYMHEEQNICHYDVKPANILVDDKDNAVLIDFGISKNYDAKGQQTTTTPVGVSEGYAPIEQYQQNLEEFSPASDVYALGATLYFLLHGRRPVSAIDRANGTALIIGGQLSQGTNNIISTSMKIPKKERPNSVSVFLKNDSPKFPSNTIMYLLISILLFVVLFILETHYFNNKKESGVPGDSCSIIETFVLKGKVNNNIPFTMHLSLDGNEVEGTEYYDNQGPNMKLTIRGITQNGLMTLDEYDGGTKAGTFTGSLDNDTYSGTFTNSKGKQYNFTSKIIDDDDLNRLEQKEQAIKDAYLSIMDTHLSKDQDDEWWSPCYFLYDITKDGIPELWLMIKDRTANTIDASLFVYTYTEKGVKSIFNGSFGHPGHNHLCKGNGYILKVCAHMGEASWSKYEYKGGLIQEQVIFNEILNEDQDGGDYTSPKEPEVKTFKMTDKKPINSIHITD